MISILYFLIFVAVALPVSFIAWLLFGAHAIGFILAVGLILSTFENALLRARLRRYCRTAKEKGVSLDLN